MQTDTIKVAFTYIIATVVIIGGGLMLYGIRLDPPDSNSANLSLLIAGFIGAATQFVFNRETQTSTARQVERGIAAGSAASNANPMPTP